MLTFRRLANPFEVTFTRSFGDEINGLRKERRDSSSSSVKTHGPQLPPPFNYRLHELNTSVGNTRPRRGTKKKKKKKSVGESLNVVFGWWVNCCLSRAFTRRRWMGSRREIGRTDCGAGPVTRILFTVKKYFFNSDISRLNESEEEIIANGMEKNGLWIYPRINPTKSCLNCSIFSVQKLLKRIIEDRVHGWKSVLEKFHEQFGIYRESGDSTSGNRRIGRLEGRAALFKAMAEKLHARGIVTGSLNGEEEAVSKGNKVWLVDPRLPLGGKTGDEPTQPSPGQVRFRKSSLRFWHAPRQLTYVTRSLHFALKFCHAVSCFHL